MNDETDDRDTSGVSDIDEKKLHHLTQQCFDKNLTEMDGKTRSVLHKRRKEALSGLNEPSAMWKYSPIWAGLASAAVVAIVVVLLPSHLDRSEHDTQSAPMQVSTQVPEWLPDIVEPWQEDYEMLEDLDMLTWLILEEEFSG